MIFPSLTRPKATPHKHYTNVYSMHLHVTDSILKDCLCDISMSIYYKQHKTDNDIYTAGETGLIFYCVNHLTFSLNNMVPGAKVLSAGNFQCTFKSACFYIP